MDGSQFGGERVQGSGFTPDPVWPGSMGREPMPEREWGLTAGQVVAVVLAIVAACELIGALS